MKFSVTGAVLSTTDCVLLNHVLNVKDSDREMLYEENLLMRLQQVVRQTTLYPTLEIDIRLYMWSLLLLMSMAGSGASCYLHTLYRSM